METLSQQCPQGYTLNYKEIVKSHNKIEYKTVSQ